MTGGKLYPAEDDAPKVRLEDQLAGLARLDAQLAEQVRLDAKLELADERANVAAFLKIGLPDEVWIHTDPRTGERSMYPDQGDIVPAPLCRNCKRYREVLTHA